jgi:hypothetical protein
MNAPVPTDTAQHLLASARLVAVVLSTGNRNIVLWLSQTLAKSDTCPAALDFVIHSPKGNLEKKKPQTSKEVGAEFRVCNAATIGEPYQHFIACEPLRRNP